MAEAPPKSPPESPPAGRAGEHAPREAVAFDRWLHRQLNELYGPVAAVSPDDELLALIDGGALATFVSRPR